MTLSTYIRTLAAIVTGLMVMTPAFAVAQTSAAAGANVSVPGASASATVSASTMTRAKGKADTEIDRRISALNDANTRVGAMSKVTTEFKQNLSVNLQAQVGILAALKAKIDADQDGATLRADVQSVTANYRIFALVMPQTRIAAAADREATIINMLIGIGTKLKARITTASAAGADVTASSASLSDMGGHLSSAQTHAQAALTLSATLVPDQGDKDKMKSNTDALNNAKKEIESARQDLIAARKDIDTILKDLRTSAGASASTTVKTQ